MIDNTSAVSVVICAYTDKRWEDILAAVASLRGQTRPADEIILVIDHNNALLERARAAMPDVRVVPNAGLRGLSGARNTGVREAVSPLIAFLDDDAVAASDWLERLMHSCADPAVLGVGGAVEPAWRGPKPSWFPPEFYWVVGCSYRGMPARLSPIRNVFGGGALIRREVFDAVGTFRQEIGRIGTHPVGDEETELCIRARQHWPEREFLYDPEARIFHQVPGDRARWSYLRARCYAEGLSKAQIVQLIGTRDGLSTERSYTTRTLPLGVLRGVTDAVKRRDVAGLGRASAIIVGFTWTVAGYAVGTVQARRAKGAARA